MLLDNQFIFSAHSLQTYLDCQKRFALFYILKQKWPAEKTLPVNLKEHQIALGNNFHRLVKQFLSGIPIEVLEKFTIDEIAPWLSNFVFFFKTLNIYQHQVEFYSRMPFLKYQLAAIFDLIASKSDGSIIILDWKTSFSPPNPEKYIQSAQAILYPFLVFETYQNIFKQPGIITPDNISLQFWFPQYPDIEVILNYNMEKHIASREIIKGLICEISDNGIDDFEKTKNNKRCDFCQYRSLCTRGILPADLRKMNLDEQLNEDSLDLDINLIDEIAM